MTSFEAFSMYIALKNHFTKKKFDYLKYNGKTRMTHQSFDKRKDKIFFQKLAKHEDVQGFLIANFIKNPKSWIKELVYSEEPEREYKSWMKKQQSLTYLFKEDLSKLLKDFNQNLKIENNQHPVVLKLYLGNRISLETLCILIKMTKTDIYFNKNLKDDPLWEEIELKIKKYTPFLQYNEEKLKKIVLDYFK
tara:strand:+ start:8549 stop:9124 length:576 start_codon:yes stop_codon:yes gene_type:complete